MAMENAIKTSKAVTRLHIELEGTDNYIIPMESETIQYLNKLRRDSNYKKKGIHLLFSLSQLRASRSISDVEENLTVPTVDELSCLSLPELSQWRQNISTALMRRLGLDEGTHSSIRYPCNIKYGKDLFCYTCCNQTENGDTKLELDKGVYYVLADCECGAEKTRLTDVSVDVENGIIVFI